MSDDRNRTASASDQIRVVFRSSLPFNTKSKPRDRCDWFDCKDIYSIWEYQTSWKLPTNRTLSSLVRCCSLRHLTWEKGWIKCPWPQFQCYEAVKRRNLNKIYMVFNEIMRSWIKVSKVELYTILYMWKAFHSIQVSISDLPWSSDWLHRDWPKIIWTNFQSTTCTLPKCYYISMFNRFHTLI